MLTWMMQENEMIKFQQLFWWNICVILEIKSCLKRVPHSMEVLVKQRKLEKEYFKVILEVQEGIKFSNKQDGIWKVPNCETIKNNGVAAGVRQNYFGINSKTLLMSTLSY